MYVYVYEHKKIANIIYDKNVSMLKLDWTIQLFQFSLLHCIYDTRKLHYKAWQGFFICVHFYTNIDGIVLCKYLQMYVDRTTTGIIIGDARYKIKMDLMLACNL